MARRTQNRTKGGRDRSNKSTLEARQDAYKDLPPARSHQVPGSNNKHKSWPH